MKALSIVSVSSIIILALTGCGGDSGSGREASAGVDNVDITGQWSGIVGNSLLITDACGVSSAPFVMSLTQTGANVTGTSSLDCGGTVLDERLSGSISGGQVTLISSDGQDTLSLVVRSSSAMFGTLTDSLGTTSAIVRVTR